MYSKPYNFEGFVGKFKKLLIQFVSLKQSLGFKYATEGDILKRFSIFTMKHKIKNHALTKEIVDGWTEKRPMEQGRTWENRTHTLGQFAKYLNDLGYDAYIPVCRVKVDRLSYVRTFLVLKNCNDFSLNAKTLNIIRSPTNTCFSRLFIGCYMDVDSGYLKRSL